MAEDGWGFTDEAGRLWLEIGTFDEDGHTLGARLADQIDQGITDCARTILSLARAGRRVRVVTDHGWLLVPGGLTKAALDTAIVEPDGKRTRCARIKVAAQTSYDFAPWSWNSAVHVAYATGAMSFFAGYDYAHGGISPQECVTPVIDVAHQGHAALGGQHRQGGIGRAFASAHRGRWRRRSSRRPAGRPRKTSGPSPTQGHPSVGRRRPCLNVGFRRPRGQDGDDCNPGRGWPRAGVAGRDGRGVSAMELDALDRKAADAFPGQLVRKDLVQRFRGQFPVPTYVVEFMLGRYFAPASCQPEIEEGLELVNEQLLDRRGARRRGGTVQGPRPREGFGEADRDHQREAGRQDRQLSGHPAVPRLNDVRIGDALVTQHERMLTGGFYAEIELGYDASIAQEKGGRLSFGR